jgi:hypothetical protein
VDFKHKGEKRMSKEILHYEVTNSYAGITKGLRFDVEHDSGHHIDADIKSGLSKETGIPTSQLNLSMLKCKEI